MPPTPEARAGCCDMLESARLPEAFCQPFSPSGPTWLSPYPFQRRQALLSRWPDVSSSSSVVPSSPLSTSVARRAFLCPLRRFLDDIDEDSEATRKQHIIFRVNIITKAQVAHYGSIGPLTDGIVVTSHALPILVRRTCININVRLRKDMQEDRENSQRREESINVTAARLLNRQVPQKIHQTS